MNLIVLTDTQNYLRRFLDDWLSFRLTDLSYRHRDAAYLLTIVVIGIAVAALCFRYLHRHGSGRDGAGIPALLLWASPSKISLIRHSPVLLCTVGVVFLAFAISDQYTSLVREDVSFPGRRIAVMIDASSSTMAKFPTARLASKEPVQNTFFTTVAAAETFIRKRIQRGDRDLIALIEFGDQAYVVTPFTNDYENVLLSLSLIGDWTEYMKFPDTGTTIGFALNESVNLFRSFDFLNTPGNLILIFSDGEDSEVSARGATVHDVLRGSAGAKIPIFFIRMAYNRHEGDVIPDALWRNAVESTGGHFYAGSDEASILQAITEVDRLGAGSVHVKQYSTERPHYASFALAACGLWLSALILKLMLPFFQKFP